MRWQPIALIPDTDADGLAVAACHADLYPSVLAIRVGMLRAIADQFGNQQRDADRPVSAHQQFDGSLTGDIAVRRGLREIATDESEIFTKFNFLDLRASIQPVMGARYRGDPTRRFL